MVMCSLLKSLSYDCYKYERPEAKWQNQKIKIDSLIVSGS